MVDTRIEPKAIEKRVRKRQLFRRKNISSEEQISSSNSDSPDIANRKNLISAMSTKKKSLIRDVLRRKSKEHRGITFNRARLNDEHQLNFEELLETKNSDRVILSDLSYSPSPQSTPTKKKDKMNSSIIDSTNGVYVCRNMAYFQRFSDKVITYAQLQQQAQEQEQQNSGSQKYRKTSKAEIDTQTSPRPPQPQLQLQQINNEQLNQHRFIEIFTCSSFFMFLFNLFTFFYDFLAK